jgi:Sulfotransferase domain
MSSPQRLWRRLRFGRPIVVVSGLPRSGTSMMMKMLSAGGLPIVTDGKRVADESNPEGYFELEAVKDLDKDTDRRWLRDARGRGVKILSPLLASLPDSYNYSVIYMLRDLREIIASQDAMLARAGEPTQVTTIESLIAEYDAHLRRTRALLVNRACFDTLFVDYADAIAAPREVAERVDVFVGGLDVDRMADAVNAQLYRQRQRS